MEDIEYHRIEINPNLLPDSDFKIVKTYIAKIKDILIKRKKLIIDEYDHKINTEECPKLDINLKHSTKLRPY